MLWAFVVTMRGTFRSSLLALHGKDPRMVWECFVILSRCHRGRGGMGECAGDY